MTATITGYCIYQGFSTALDTLCPQAYGSGKKLLVGLHLQRMSMILLLLTIPIGVLWFNFTAIFLRILPDSEYDVAVLAGLYLKIVLAGAPGYALFEAGKRFFQAQGLFTPILLVLVICASVNVFLSWLFVWKLNWGFVGAPISVSIAMDLLPILLALYVYLFRGSECWVPISKNIWKGWGPMFRLAIPSWLMVEAEFATWEVMTLSASYLGTRSLAAQSGLTTVTCFAFYVGFSVSVASGTRVAQLIGAGILESVQTATRVAFCAAACAGLFNFVVIMGLRGVLPPLFTSDVDVRHLTFTTLPMIAVLSTLDPIVACLTGILRAIGRPALGTSVQIPVYYVLAIPLALVMAFRLHWGLLGQWGGLLIGQSLVIVIESGLLWYMLDWDKAAEDAYQRNYSV
ncbi:hypothetical protein N7481_000702 [Penicillium waksmanii]|uniref:uncharacterized protein n=1 Tax=Penicillium waksmanii TaxID=69791 RepID=UPI0025471197|nr:uncharacterized protein N7481_000702 [Penicillium waksmanii]KAJ6000293.1 hypothetical protein N7481_000702 [Penicillium waksmanii]